MIKVVAILGTLLVAIIAIQTHRLKGETKGRIAAELQRDQATAQIEAEQQARSHEQRIAKEASDAYETELNRIRTSPDLGVVRLCPRPRVPQAASTSPATGQPDAETSRHIEVEDAPDIGPSLNDFVEDCEANAAQLDALQSWIRSR